jgi:hypothetical protein
MVRGHGAECGLRPGGVPLQGHQSRTERYMGHISVYRFNLLLATSALLALVIAMPAHARKTRQRKPAASKQVTRASWYGKSFEGRRTASGGICPMPPRASWALSAAAWPACVLNCLVRRCRHPRLLWSPPAPGPCLHGCHRRLLNSGQPRRRAPLWHVDRSLFQGRSRRSLGGRSRWA